MFSDNERAEIESVKGVVQKKLRELLSELPTDIYPYFKESILTGGCFASLFLDEEVHDWDVYLRDSVSISRFESFVMSDTPTLNEVADVTSGYMIITNVDGKLVTANAITFKNGLQVIIKADKTHRDTFDFVHCMPYFDMKTQQLFISRLQYDCIKQKQLVKNAKHQQTMSHHRVEKFLKRGWTIRA